MSKDSNAKKEQGQLSGVSAAFVENSSFIRKFLARYFLEKQDIEDVAQEAYLRAFVAEKKKEIDHPKAFLFRIAKNVALTKLTKKSNQITHYIEEMSTSILLDDEPSAADEVEALELFGIYCEAVASMPDKCRQVFLMRKVHGLTHQEIAERMSLSISSVEKYLRQGVLVCRTTIGDHDRAELSPSKNWSEPESPGIMSK